MDANDLNSAKTFRNKLINKKYPKTNLQTKSWGNLSLFTLKKITTPLENKKIFHRQTIKSKISSKKYCQHIKRTMKIELRVLIRFMLKIKSWG